MINHIITKDKTMFYLFNMIQPNCYQAYIIQCIIEDRKQDAISYCNELQTAVNYYKWNVHNNTTDYTDCLICNSELEQWQKIALLHIVSNDYNKCKDIIELEIAKLERMNSTKFDCVNRCMNDNNIVITINITFTIVKKIIPFLFFIFFCSLFFVLLYISLFCKTIK